VPTAGAHLVRLGERLDLIAAVTLGDAELSWMLADANAAMRPSQLAQPGAALLIPAGGSMAVSGAQ
jgi:hypothetical protein